MIDVNQYFRVNLKKHAAMAWKGYQSKGRGAIVARIHFPDNNQVENGGTARLAVLYLLAGGE